MSTQDEVIAILAEQAMIEPSDVAMHNTLDDLGIDSMALVETIFAIEEAFDISVPFNANAPSDTAFDISTVASIVGAVDKLTSEQA